MTYMDPRTMRVTEAGSTGGGIWQDAKTLYLDHQPGDATRYEILAVELGHAQHLGQLGYVGHDAILVVAGNGGRAYLFHKGDDISEDYIEEKFALTNPHTIHHVAELVARAISGSVVGCAHEVRRS